MSDWSSIGGALTKDEGGTDVANSRAVSLVGGTPANNKGVWKEFVASTAFDSDGIGISYGGGTEDKQIILDIGVGASSSEQVIVPDIHWAQGDRAILGYVVIPIFIPAGTRLAGRCQVSSAGGSIRVGIVLTRGGFPPSSPLAVVTNYGADAGDSGGEVIDPGGSANTKGSWVEMVASCEETRLLHMFIGQRANITTAVAHFLFDIGVGGAGSEKVIVENCHYRSGLDENIGPASRGPLLVSIPAGSRISVRAQSDITDATDRLMDIVLLGVG